MHSNKNWNPSKPTAFSPSPLLPQVNFELRRLAERKGQDEDNFTKLANSVDEFTNCLLEPLKTDKEARYIFGETLDCIVEAGIKRKQKKVYWFLVL